MNIPFRERKFSQILKRLQRSYIESDSRIFLIGSPQFIGISLAEQQELLGILKDKLHLINYKIVDDGSMNELSFENILSESDNNFLMDVFEIKDKNDLYNSCLYEIELLPSFNPHDLRATFEQFKKIEIKVDKNNDDAKKLLVYINERCRLIDKQRTEPITVLFSEVDISSELAEKILEKYSRGRLACLEYEVKPDNNTCELTITNISTFRQIVKSYTTGLNKYVLKLLLSGTQLCIFFIETNEKCVIKKYRQGSIALETIEYVLNLVKTKLMRIELKELPPYLKESQRGGSQLAQDLFPKKCKDIKKIFIPKSGKDFIEIRCWVTNKDLEETGATIEQVRSLFNS